nr:hypothetical protein [Pedobacter sp. ASV19]
MNLYKSTTYCLTVSIGLILIMDAATVCAQARPSTVIKNDPGKNGNTVTPQLLQRQIALGTDPSRWGFNAANKEDLEVSLALQDSILLKNGYQKSKDFLQKAQAIFNLKNSRWQTDPVQLEIGFDENINATRCYEPSDGLRLVLKQQRSHVFVSVKHQLVGNLFLVPQLIDKDLDQQRNTIQQTIIARNRYLFNNDKSQLHYLWQNDNIFMNALVEIFGYGKDENLLKGVLQKYNAESTDFETGPDKLGRIIFPKDCNKKLEVKKDMLAYIVKSTSKSDVRLMFSLGVFASNLIRAEDESLNRLYSKAEWREVVAYIAAIYDPAFKAYRETNNANWPKVPLLAFLFRRDPGAEQAIKQQKYYGLSQLAELIAFSKENFSDDFLFH